MSIFALTRAGQLYINEVVLGTVFGVLIGPHVGNLLDPRSWTSDINFLTREVTRIVLVIGLFIIGVRLPEAYMAKKAKSLLAMVIPTMAIGWVIVAGMCPFPLSRSPSHSYTAVMHALFNDLNFTSCLVIAACLTPTDPIVCAVIVGKSLFEHAETHKFLTLVIQRESMPKIMWMRSRVIFCLPKQQLTTAWLSPSFPCPSTSLLTRPLAKPSPIGLSMVAYVRFTRIPRTDSLMSSSKDEVIMGTVIGALLGICFILISSQVVNSLSRLHVLTSHEVFL